MAIKLETLKASEKEIKGLCVKWCNTGCEDKEHKEAERKLRSLGFTAWNLISLLYGELDYE